MPGLKRVLDRRGMTLVEVIVSILMVAVFALTLVVAFGSGGALIRKGIRDEQLGSEELSQLESGTGTAAGRSVTFRVGESSGEFTAKSVTVQGALVESAAGEDGEISLYVFRPQSADAGEETE